MASRKATGAVKARVKYLTRRERGGVKRLAALRSASLRPPRRPPPSLTAGGRAAGCTAEPPPRCVRVCVWGGGGGCACAARAVVGVLTLPLLPPAARARAPEPVGRHNREAGDVQRYDERLERVRRHVQHLPHVYPTQQAVRLNRGHLGRRTGGGGGGRGVNRGPSPRLHGRARGARGAWVVFVYPPPPPPSQLERASVTRKGAMQVSARASQVSVTLPRSVEASWRRDMLESSSWKAAANTKKAASHPK